MKNKITIIANWKMYQSFNASIANATDNFDALEALAQNTHLSLMLAPTLPAIPELATIFKDANVRWCAQDCSEHIAGAYTGQVSAETLKAIGCTACIIGHSERRKYNNESNESVAHKLQALLDYDLSPVICIGEQEEDFKSGKTITVLAEQLKPVIEVLVANQHKTNGLPVYIAYEPVWSIGTGKIATDVHLENVYSWLHQEVQKQAPALTLQFLYGGSVSPQTITFFKKFAQINGFLIGKASLDFQEFEKIVKCIMV